MKIYVSTEKWCKLQKSELQTEALPVCPVETIPEFTTLSMTVPSPGEYSIFTEVYMTMWQKESQVLVYQLHLSWQL